MIMASQTAHGLLTLAVWASTGSALTAEFTVTIKHEVNRHSIFSIFVLPQEEVNVEITPAAQTYALHAGAGELTATGRSQWRYRAPATPGLAELEISAPDRAQKMRVMIFVLIPFARLAGEYLNQYRIGTYPERAQGAYSTPAGFVEVTRENQNTFLTPHFQLRQFLCKQAGDYPKYLVLHERLLLALEFILLHVRQAGFKVETLAILSGYRTPFYNDNLENKTYSRHLYGDAADIFIDADHDGKMDDLDEDGDIDIYDVKILYDFIDRLSAQADYQPFTGGLGLYKKTAAHSGFVHVDTRGTKARW